MKVKEKNTIAGKLKRIREKAGYSIETLADLLNLDIELISKWEDETEEPTLSQSLLLSKLYGVPVDDLFYNVDVDAIIPEEKQEHFQYSAWLNRLSNRSYC